MSRPEISILVPIYKVESFLPRFLESVLVQDFTDWEMILVDDGSPDACPQIADEAASKDERIKVIHKENGGLVSARKAGFQNSIGRYLVFWDSDDVVPSDSLSLLYNAITKGYDIVRAGAKKLTDDAGLVDLEPYEFTEGEIIGVNDYILMQSTGKIPSYLWNGIYRRELFDESVFDASIDNKISVGEDWVTNLIVGLRVKKVLVIPDVVYYYYTNLNSMMQSSVYSIQYQDRVDEVLRLNGVLDVESIRDGYDDRRICGSLFRFFTPEFSFSLSLYKKVIEVRRQEKYRQLMNELSDKRYLYFINIFPIFWLYSRTYCFLLKRLKMKGKTRKIIY